jgi:lipopolysaccharide export LptBFGC system permease protein LptF
MTRLLDRYVLGIFIPALLMFTLTLLFLFVAIDFASKLGKFLELRDVPLVPFILKYYLVRIPLFVSIVLPAVMIFAPTFTVIKLARANEILPIAASGTSLRRMSLPFVLAAFAGTGAMAVMDEFVLPVVGEVISETDDVFAVRNMKYNLEEYDGHTKMFAKSFSPESLLLSGDVRFTLLSDQQQPEEIILAEEARWEAKRKRWVAYRGTVERPFQIVEVPGEKPRTWKQAIPPEGYAIDCKLRPETIRRSSGLSSRFSFLKLKPMILEARRYAHVPSTVLKVHARFSFPLSPVVLLLVGLPFVMDPESKSFIKGLIFCFLLVVGYYLIHFACLDLGSRGAVSPVAAAWFPVVTFGVAGVTTFSRMRT